MRLGFCHDTVCFIMKDVQKENDRLNDEKLSVESAIHDIEHILVVN